MSSQADPVPAPTLEILVVEDEPAVRDLVARVLGRAGYAEAVAEVRERHAAGDRAGALAAVSDEMVDGIDVMGDAGHVHDAVRAYADNGVDVPIVFPLPWGPDRMAVIDATLRAAAGTGSDEKSASTGGGRCE